MYLSPLCGNISSGWGWVLCARAKGRQRKRKGGERDGRCADWRSERRVKKDLSGGLLLHPGDIICGTRDPCVGESRQTFGVDSRVQRIARCVLPGFFVRNCRERTNDLSESSAQISAREFIGPRGVPLFENR